MLVDSGLIYLGCCVFTTCIWRTTIRDIALGTSHLYYKLLPPNLA